MEQFGLDLNASIVQVESLLTKFPTCAKSARRESLVLIQNVIKIVIYVYRDLFLILLDQLFVIHVDLILYLN